MKKVNKVNVSIIIILAGMLCLLAGYVMFDKIMATKNSNNDSSKGNSSEKVSNSSISLDNRIELNNLIDNDLVVLLYKEKLSDLTDLELRTITRQNNYDKISDNSDFTSDELKKVFDNSVFSELKYEDGNIGTDCAGTVSDMDMYIYDANTKTYSINSNIGAGGCTVARPYVYTYNVDSYMDGDKYVIVNQYLFGNASGLNTVEESKYLFGSISDDEDYLNGFRHNTKIDASKSIVTLDNIGEEDTDTTLFMGALNEFTSDYKNYESIKDKLDTYTYTFEKKDGRFVITDFSVEHSK